MIRLGILGIGNMGEAILRGVLKADVLPAKEITIFDLNTTKLHALQSELDVLIALDMQTLFQQSDLILLAVKPNVCESIFAQHFALFDSKAVISIIAGWSREKLASCLPESTRILRVMPNTPAMVGEGMIVLEQGDTLSEAEHQFAESLLSAVGKLSSVSPKLMDAVTAVSGSGPAYVYMMIEAMGDGGVQAGLPRSIAYQLAAQTVLGSAKMVLETGIHPGELKDRVCSPGGTTIDAVAALEKDGFRYSVMDAVHVCCEKSAQMSKTNK